MYCSPRRAIYGFTLRGPANRLAETVGSTSASSSFCTGRVGITSGRVSNLMGACLSLISVASWDFDSGAMAAGLAAAGLAAAGLTAAGLTGVGFARAALTAAGFAA